MDALNGMGPSVTDTPVMPLKKQSTSQEAMDNEINEMSKKFEERNTISTNQFNDFEKNQTQQPQRGSFSQNRGQNSNFPKGNNRGRFRGRYRGSSREFRGLRPNFQRPQWQNQNQNSYTTRQVLTELFSVAKLDFFFSSHKPRTFRDKSKFPCNKTRVF